MGLGGCIFWVVGVGRTFFMGGLGWVEMVGGIFFEYLLLGRYRLGKLEWVDIFLY